MIIRYQLSDDLFSILAGGTGNDQLYGDNGLDIFDFDHLGTVNADTVFNFSTSLDQIDLRDLLTSYDSLTELITDYVQITDFGANSEIRVDTSGAGSFGGDTLVATINGVTGLTDEAALVTSGNLIL